jgi:hypothetical protein
MEVFMRLLYHIMFVALLGLVGCGDSSDTIETPPLPPTPASAGFFFPVTHAETNAETLTVSGWLETKDVVAAVQVNGVDMQSDDGFLTWRGSVPLSEGENNLLVSVEGQNDEGEVAFEVAQPPVTATRAQADLFVPTRRNNQGLDVELQPDLETAFVAIPYRYSQTPQFEPPQSSVEKSRVDALSVVTVIAELDLVSGSLRNVSGPNRGSGPIISELTTELFYHAPSERLLAIGTHVNSERLIHSVFSIDPATGDRSVLVDDDEALSRFDSRIMQGDSEHEVLIGGGTSIATYIQSLDLESGILESAILNGVGGPLLDLDGVQPMAYDPMAGRLYSVLRDPWTGPTNAIHASNKDWSDRSAIARIVVAAGQPPPAVWDIQVSADGSQLYVLLRDPISHVSHMVEITVDSGEYRLLFSSETQRYGLTDIAYPRALFLDWYGNPEQETWSPGLESWDISASAMLSDQHLQVTETSGGPEITGFEYDSDNRRLLVKKEDVWQETNISTGESRELPIDRGFALVKSTGTIGTLSFWKDGLYTYDLETEELAQAFEFDANQLEAGIDCHLANGTIEVCQGMTDTFTPLALGDSGTKIYGTVDVQGRVPFWNGFYDLDLLSLTVLDATTGNALEQPTLVYASADITIDSVANKALLKQPRDLSESIEWVFEPILHEVALLNLETRELGAVQADSTAWTYFGHSHSADLLNRRAFGFLENLKSVSLFNGEETSVMGDGPNPYWINNLDYDTTTNTLFGHMARDQSASENQLFQIDVKTGDRVILKPR